MFLFKRPDQELILRTADRHRHTELAYAHAGWTREYRCPDRFTTNRSSAVIGQGESVFQRAKAAICEYQMLQLGWIQTVGPQEPVARDSVVCTLARHWGVYTLNVARIVYVDDSLPDRFGFAYGTTQEYPLAGEERFTVSINGTTGEVTYEIFSFSRPLSLLVWLVLPSLRRAQRRFCRDSTTALRNACRT